MRDHEPDRKRGPGEAHGGDRAACDRPPPGERVPNPEPGEDERDLFFARRREHRADGERGQPVLVQVPEREQEQRRRQRHRMELVQGQPLHSRQQQVREREAEAGALRVEVLAREPVDGQRAEGDRDCLRDEQHVLARPQPPERREEGENRVDVRGQARDLVALQVRDPQRPAVRRRPDRLHHVAEVEAAGLEGAVAQHRERRECGCIGRDRRPEQPRRPHSSPASSSRQRRPSTSSLARSR